jgi:hypothetical protein
MGIRGMANPQPITSEAQHPNRTAAGPAANENESGSASTAASERHHAGRPRWLRRANRAGNVAAVLVLAGSISLGWVFRRPWFEGNLAVVDPDRVIRSAQPTSQLGRWVKDYHLRTVLNLRGGNSSDWWYRSETATVKAHSVVYYDLPLAATRRPTRRELLLLIDVLNRCPYPLLIHCKSGADRTGLASALYLMLKRNQPPQTAENAFALEYGHIPFFGTEHLHEPLHEYAAWLNDHCLSHSPERFRAWVKTEYRAADPPVDPPLWPMGPRAEFDKHHSRAATANRGLSKANTATEPAETPPARRSSGP